MPPNSSTELLNPAHKPDDAAQRRPTYEPQSDESTPLTSHVRWDCPRCRHRNDVDSLFCVNCGLPFDGEAAPPILGAHPSIGPTGTLYQGFWIRVLAYVIDFVALYVGFIIVRALIGELDNYSATTDFTAHDAYYLLFGVLYDIILVGAFGATFGKYVVGIKIIQYDGSRVGYGRAAGRYFAACLSGLFLGIGYLVVAVKSDKRALHDLIAGTVVI